MSIPRRFNRCAGWRVVRLAGREADAEDLFETRGSQMNLGVEAGPAASDGLRIPVFTAPVPSGCTFTLVLSN